jgi:tripartite-type tricarboxylate transporter receptor subunit TctC
MRKADLFLVRIAGFTLACLLAWNPGAWAQYPTKPINFYLGWDAGGNTDVIVRPLCSAAAKVLGQPIIVLNKPGAATSVSLVQLKGEKPDGYTIGYMTGSSVLMEHLQDVPYNVTSDFTPIQGFLSWNTMGIVVRSESPWKTMKELVEYAKANPGKIKYSTPAAGNPNHMAMEIVAKEEKLKWTHIPAKGCQNALQNLLGKHIDVIATDPCWKSYVESKELRLLATFASKRSKYFPDTPTFMDLGYNTSIVSFGAIIGPKGLPAPVTERLHQAFKEAMNNPDFIRTAGSFAIDTDYRDPAGIAADIKKLSKQYGDFVKEFGLKQK